MTAVKSMRQSFLLPAVRHLDERAAMRLRCQTPAVDSTRMRLKTALPMTLRHSLCVLLATIGCGGGTPSEPQLMEDLELLALVDADGDGVVADEVPQSVRLSDWLAENRPGTKVIMLNAAAGWCSPCKREAAALADFAADYQAAGVVVLTAIFQDQEGRPADEDFARTWAHTFGLGTPVLIDATFATGRWFDVGTMPANMFVDARTGEILEIATGAETDVDPMKVYRDLLDHYLATR